MSRVLVLGRETSLLQAVDRARYGLSPESLRREGWDKVDGNRVHA